MPVAIQAQLAKWRLAQGRPGGPRVRPLLPVYDAARVGRAGSVHRGLAPARRRHCSAAGGSTIYEAFPFSEAEYYKTGVHLMIQGQADGYLIMLRESRDGRVQVDHQGRALVVAVGGDTFHAIDLLLQGRSAPRPLTVDLLWRTLERGQAISRQAWSIVRVAIIDMKQTAFIARLWFGDRESNDCFWDVDCRPSDAVWLALKSHAPIFVHRRVWSEYASSLEDFREQARWQAAHLAATQQAAEAATAVHTMNDRVDLSTVMVTPAQDDPEPLRRIKMELRVALSEEDYRAAARIRDHPFLRLHLAAVVARQEGDVAAADKYDMQLLSEIARVHAPEEM